MIKNTAIVGMGALGLLYGDYITQRLGRDAVSYILDGDRLERYRDREFYCNGKKREYKMVSSAEAKPADLVIVAVKFSGLGSALETMKNCVGEDTIIISVMNGISSERIIGERYGSGRVLCAVAQGMDAAKLGDGLTFVNMGEIRLGFFEQAQKPLLDKVTAFFDSVDMPYMVEENIVRRLWSKFMLNVGVNQTCMVYETNYRGVTAPGEARDTMIAAMREVLALANAEGVGLTEEDIEFDLDLIDGLSPEGIPSMRQDGVMRRYSEVEMFAGTVIEMARTHGLDTPANHFLYGRVKAIEAQY